MDSLSERGAAYRLATDIISASLLAHVQRYAKG
jgi:hypothetical protein